MPAAYVDFWGFKANGDPDAVQADVTAFLKAVGGSRWENTLTQYYGSGGNIANPRHQLAAVWNDDANPIPAHPSAAQITAELLASVAVFGYDPNGAYVVVTAHNHGAKGFGSTFCGYHSAATASPGMVPYIYAGYMPDAGANCGAGLIPNAPDQPSADEGMTIVLGGEYADTITDPFGSGWHAAQGSEVAGLCGAFSSAQNVRFGHEAFALGPLWSNAQSSCLF